MMNLPPLGDRKPSVMLAEMMSSCPAGESTYAMFTYLFLQRLLREIRVLLFEDDLADVRAIADKVDRLIAMHIPQGHDACAAVAGSEDSDPGEWVAAAQAEEIQVTAHPAPPAAAEGQRQVPGRPSPPSEPAGRSVHIDVLLSREVR